jgi:hypothetical protein
MTSTGDLDLSQMSIDQFFQKIGRMVYTALSLDGQAMCCLRKDGSIVLVPPDTMFLISDEDLAMCLLEVWSEDDVEEFLIRRDQRRVRGPGAEAT